MGTVRHEGLLITGHDLKECRDYAVSLFQRGLVSAMSLGASNEFQSFAIFPCGSNLGWKRADDHIDAIEHMITYLTGKNHTWVHVQYGDEGAKLL